MKDLGFKPKLFGMLGNYQKANLIADVMAGIIVGIVASFRSSGEVKYRLAALRGRLSSSYMALSRNTGLTG